MSPELYRKLPFDGHAVDIWAAGTILLFMLTGKRLQNPPLIDRAFDGVELGISHDAMDLLRKMFRLDPKDRLCLEEIKNHPFVRYDINVNALKCPVTGMLFNNPVINKVCHHTYDRAGLDQLLRTGKRTCPVPGCANNHLSLSQVEEDEEMKLKVQRHKTREVAQKKQRDLENPPC